MSAPGNELKISAAFTRTWAILQLI